MLDNLPSHILVVDDLASNRELLSTLLGNRGYTVRTAENGEEALADIAANPPGLVLLDINMPGLDGYEVCERLHRDPGTRDIPVLVISTLSEPDDKVRAFRAGAVDYIPKPFHVDEIEARVQAHLKLRLLQAQLAQQNRDLASRVAAQVRQISDAQMATIFALAKLAESRDDDTGKHLERVQMYCRLLAAALQQHPERGAEIDEAFVENVFRASPLHDIGKVAIPDRVLKKPANLTPEEADLMKTHTTLGLDTLAAVLERYPDNSFLEMGIDIAQRHHEQWDGSGYPDGLRGTAIPLSARIMALADVYDAMRSDRCYKQACSHAETVDAIRSRRGTHFDPAVVDAFLDIESEFDRLHRSIMEQAVPGG